MKLIISAHDGAQIASGREQNNGFLGSKYFPFFVKQEKLLSSHSSFYEEKLWLATGKANWRFQ